MVAIELIHASRVSTRFIFRHYDNPKWVGIKMPLTEPTRIFRTYLDRGSMAKDIFFLQARTWPTAKPKAAIYVGLIIRESHDPLADIVWC
jgi:hypothetical protein